MRLLLGIVMAAVIALTPASAQDSATASDAGDLVSHGFRELEEHRYAQARAAFDRAIAANPNHAAAHAGRAIVLIYLDRLDEAEAELATAFRLDENEFAAHRGLGHLNFVRGRPDDAVRSFTRSLEIQPANRFSLRHRALAYAGLARMDDALADIDRALRDGPDDAGLLLTRARMLAAAGRREEAIATMRRAAATDPGNFLLTTALGDMLTRYGLGEEAAAVYCAALASFDAFIASDPSYDRTSTLVDLHLGLLARLGRVREGLDLADAYMSGVAYDPMILVARCTFRVEASPESPLALPDCNLAVQLIPGSTNALTARALLYLKLGRWPEAEHDFGQVIEADRRDAGAPFGRGLARIRQGDRAGGERDLAAARRLRFDVEDEFVRLGLAEPAAPAAPAAATD